MNYYLSGDSGYPLEPWLLAPVLGTHQRVLGKPRSNVLPFIPWIDRRSKHEAATSMGPKKGRNEPETHQQLRDHPPTPSSPGQSNVRSTPAETDLAVTISAAIAAALQPVFGALTSISHQLEQLQDNTEPFTPFPGRSSELATDADPDHVSTHDRGPTLPAAPAPGLRSTPDRQQQ